MNTDKKQKGKEEPDCPAGPICSGSGRRAFGLFLVFIRVHPCYPWFLFSFSPCHPWFLFFSLLRVIRGCASASLCPRGFSFLPREKHWIPVLTSSSSSD
jgi:hypothetical protein